MEIVRAQLPDEKYGEAVSNTIDEVRVGRSDAHNVHWGMFREHMMANPLNGMIVMYILAIWER